MLIDPFDVVSAHPGEIQDHTARQSAELRHIKSRFLASLNHQIRTPMSGILGMIDLLMETPLDTEQKEYVVATRICAQELFDLLSASLDFSALLVEGVPLKESEFDLADTLESALADSALQAESKRLDLFADIGEDLPQIAVGDSARLRQILAQLLSNAVKFTSEGQVELRAGSSPLTPERFLLEVEVRDTGPGVSPQKLASLFPCGAASDQWHETAGLGLGLVLCRRVAHLMGGKLEAASKLGEGSVFRLSVPMGLPEAPAMANWDPGLKGRHVLVLNARETAANAMARLLGQFGLRATVATSIQKAGRVLEAHATAGTHVWGVVFDDERLSEDPALIPAALRMGRGGPFFLSMVWPSRAHRLSPAAADGELVKPVRRYALYDILLGLLSRTAEPILGPRRILVTEDNLISQRLVAHVLRRGGYLVETASSGDASVRAVQSAGNRHYDLILMDLQMPGIDGLEATDEIRRLPQGAHVPIVALTADTSEETRAHCRDRGMNGYLVKPIRSEELLSAVARCLAT